MDIGDSIVDGLGGDGIVSIHHGRSFFNGNHSYGVLRLVNITFLFCCQQVLPFDPDNVDQTLNVFGSIGDVGITHCLDDFFFKLELFLEGFSGDFLNGFLWRNTGVGFIFLFLSIFIFGIDIRFSIAWLLRADILPFLVEDFFLTVFLIHRHQHFNHIFFNLFHLLDDRGVLSQKFSNENDRVVA